MPAPNVLLIEMDRAFADEVSATFSAHGCSVEVIEDGQAAIEAAEQTPPALVVLSVELRGLNGFAVCNKFKRHPTLQHVPLVVLSSSSPRETFEQHAKLRTRAQDYLHKPVDPEELFARCLSYLPLEPQDAAETISLDEDISLDIVEETGASPAEVPTEVPETPPPVTASRIPPALSASIASGSGAPPPSLRSAPPPAAPPATGVLDDLDSLADAAFSRLVLHDENKPHLDATRPSSLSARFEPREPPAEGGGSTVVISHAALASLAEPGDALRPAMETPAEVEADSLSLDLEPIAATRSSPPRPEASAAAPEPFAPSAPREGDDEALRRALEEVARLRAAADEVVALRRELDESRARAARSTGTSTRDFLELRESLNKKDKEILRLRDELSVRERTALDAADKLRALEHDRADLEEKLLAKDRHIADLDDQLATAEREAQSLRQTSEASRATLEESATKAQREHEQALAKLRAEHDASLASERAAREQSERAAADALRDALSRAETQRTESVATARAELQAKIDAAARALEEHTRDAEQSMERARTEHAKELEAAREAHARALSEERARAEAAERVSSERGGELDAIRAKLTDAEQRAARSVQTQEELTRTLAERTQDLSRREAERDALSARVERAERRSQTEAERVLQTRKSLEAAMALLAASDADTE